MPLWFERLVYGKFLIALCMFYNGTGFENIVLENQFQFKCIDRAPLTYFTRFHTLLNEKVLIYKQKCFRHPINSTDHQVIFCDYAHTGFKITENRWLTTCLQYVGPIFGNLVWNDNGFVSLTYWRTNFHCFKLCFRYIWMPHNMIILFCLPYFHVSNSALFF